MKLSHKILIIVIGIIIIMGILAFTIKPQEKISEESLGNIKDEIEKVHCTEEEKQTEICTMEYNPVCGNNKRIYSNPCFACSSKEIEFWTAGNCE